MQVTSLELCRELYELSGWKATDYRYGKYNGVYMREITYTETGKHGSIPAYDLGYLLRKLPDNVILTWDIEDGAKIYYSEWCFRGGVYIEGQGWDYDNQFEDAAAKLAIELFKQGILAKD